MILGNCKLKESIETDKTCVGEDEGVVLGEELGVFDGDELGLADG